MKLKGKLLLAYTAGIIDGEGCIGIYRHKDKNVRRGFGYCLYVSMWSTNQWLIQWLKMNYGGYVLPHPKVKEKGSISKKSLWKWQLTARKAVAFLELILPYLYLKRPEAELAISFQKANSKRQKSEDSLVLIEAQRILMTKMKRNSEQSNTALVRYR